MNLEKLTMPKPIDTSRLPAVHLQRNADGSVTGTIQGPRAVVWPAHYSAKPTRRNKRVIINCAWYRAEWQPAAEEAAQ